MAEAVMPPSQHPGVHAGTQSGVILSGCSLCPMVTHKNEKLSSQPPLLLTTRKHPIHGQPPPISLTTG
ncbi:hypothetical protein PBY51_008793 [Eleginops maclovinus]|uniref:Uncharacterized protein n=1 Tax=Eleginops maclovinus TaxID=56733 RepID=A0AAN7WVI8_ELEMC|nr:hypothetical protein PBY51_008793 [Eleginops maclovinus]